MPDLDSKDDGDVSISTTPGSIDGIMDVMFSIQSQRHDEFISIELWKQALHAITSSINLLAKSARAEFIDLIMKSFDGNPKASVEFLTFVGSLIRVCNGEIVHGDEDFKQTSSSKKNAKNSVVFGVAGKKMMECLLKVSD